MLHALWSWLLGLFGKKSPPNEIFSGWIKDEVDARDQIFTGEK